MKKKLLCLIVFIFLLGGCSATWDSNPDKTVISGVGDLPGKSIGVQLGTAEDLSASQIEDATIVEYNSPYDAIQALSQDKLDCVIINEQAAAAFVEKDASLRILEEAFGYEEAAICVAKDNDDLTIKLNEIITEILKIELQKKINMTCNILKRELPCNHAHYSQMEGSSN